MEKLQLLVLRINSMVKMNELSRMFLFKTIPVFRTDVLFKQWQKK